MVVEGDASAGIKDGGMTVAVEVCGDDLRESRERGRHINGNADGQTVKRSERRETNTYLVLCVSQNALHGSISCSLHNLLDIIVFGLLRRKEILFAFEGNFR